MSDGVKAIARALHRKIMLSMRAVADSEEDPIAQEATEQLANLYDASESWLDTRDLDDAIIISRTVALNGYRQVSESRHVARTVAECLANYALGEAKLSREVGGEFALAQACAFDACAKEARRYADGERDHALRSG